MKIDRHSQTARVTRVKLNLPGASASKTGWLRFVCAVLIAVLFVQLAVADDAKTSANAGATTTAQSVSQSKGKTSQAASQPQATQLLRQVLHGIALGPAFDAKIRETVWATGREVVGVGTYEQAGGGSGRFNLQITMHDGDGKHRLQQISDGRLAWTRSEIAGKVSLRRVDVGRLDEWIRNTSTPSTVAPRLKVGGWTEMLDTVDRDYIVRVDAAKLQKQPVWVISGTLREEVREQILSQSGRDQWPMLCPTQVRVAIASRPDPETGFGKLLPTRIEFWSDPITATPQSETSPRTEGRLITLIELYSIRPISPPPIERFRFDNREVNFTNETDRYIQRYGVELTASQRRLMRR